MKPELRCLYTNKACYNPRSAKGDGGLHRFCMLHRNKAKEAQCRWRSRKMGVKVTDGPTSAAAATVTRPGVEVTHNDDVDAAEAAQAALALSAAAGARNADEHHRLAGGSDHEPREAPVRWQPQAIALQPQPQQQPQHQLAPATVVSVPRLSPHATPVVFRHRAAIKLPSLQSYLEKNLEQQSRHEAAAAIASLRLPDPRASMYMSGP